MAKYSRAEIRRIIGENCTEEMENALVALHLGVVDPMRDELLKAKEDAEKLPKVQKELDDLKTAETDKTDYKAKYEALVAENAAKAERTAKTDAVRKLLKKIGVASKRVDTVLKVVDLGAVKLDDKGDIVDSETLETSLKKEWSDFIVTTEHHSAETATPPANNGGKRYGSKDEILAIKDTRERQKAIAENITLFTQKEG